MDRRPPPCPLVLLVERYQDKPAPSALAPSASGFEVEAIADGGEAHRRAWELHPDVVVIDLPMPNDDGWQFPQVMRQGTRTRDVPVVAVSGHVQRSVLERTARDGFTAFFPKPSLPDELAAGLRQVLDGKTHAQVER